MNDKGVIVLSTNLPPKYAAKGFSIVDSYGRTLEVIPPAKTKQQIAEAKRREQIRITEQKKIDLQNKADAELLRQFTTLEDIERAKQNQIKSIDIEIEIREAAANRSRNQLEDDQKKAADYERQGKTVPKVIRENIISFQQSIEDSHQFVKKRKEKQAKINTKFENDIARFRGLNLQRLRKAGIDRKERNRLKLYQYNCKDLAECVKAWQLAQLYANQNSTTPIQAITETIIVTQPPKRNTDISLTISKVPDKEMNYSIQMQVSCNDSPDGKSLCLTYKVKSIQSGLVPFIRTYLANK